MPDSPRVERPDLVYHLIEAELWFLHKTADGKETSQRQVARMRDGGRGNFHFDDMRTDRGTRCVHGTDCGRSVRHDPHGHPLARMAPSASR